MRSSGLSLSSHKHSPLNSLIFFFPFPLMQSLSLLCRIARQSFFLLLLRPRPPPIAIFPKLFLSTYAQSHPDLLTLSSNSQSLAQTKSIHAAALVGGLLPQSVCLSASLILNYAFHNDQESFFAVFYGAVPFAASAFIWNTFIRAHSVCGIDDGFRAYNGMARAGVRPDDHTFPFVLKSCADYVEVDKGSEIHGCVFKLGFDSDVYVGNTLLQFYGCVGDLLGVQQVFDEMHEMDNVTWNTIIGVFSVFSLHSKVLGLFKGMFSVTGLMPNVVTVTTLLPDCAAVQDEVATLQIHGYVIKVGLDTNMRVGNALVDAYGKCRSIETSRLVFDKMAEKNQVSWNSMITSLTYLEYYEDAWSTFREMVLLGVHPDSVTISSILPVLVELECFSIAREVHGFSIRKNLDSDVFIANSLIDMYAKSEQPVKASIVFRRTNRKNVVSWNAVVANYAQNGLELEAVSLIREMQAHGLDPSSVTFTNVLPACARIGFIQQGKQIHAMSIRLGLISDLLLTNSLVDMYVKCSSFKLARSLFAISQKDEVSYNILIVGYSQTSNCLESLNLFSEMQIMGMEYEIVSFVGVVSACANLAAIKQGKEIHGLLIRKHLHSHLFIANSLLDLYTKCGQIHVSKRVFDHMLAKDVASWNTIIMGYGMLGQSDIAINLFEEMRYGGVEPDSVSYIAILSACAHGGLVELGMKYFNEMQSANIHPSMTHYACVVDMLGRAALLKEAVKFIEGLPIVPDANIWGALLGACRLHRNVELVCWAADRLLELRPRHSGYYVLLSNVYAEAGRWKEADKVRSLMKSRGVVKNPGFSWVQMQDRVHAFVVGEKVEDMDVVWLAESS